MRTRGTMARVPASPWLCLFLLTEPVSISSATPGLPLLRYFASIPAIKPGAGAWGTLLALALVCWQSSECLFLSNSLLSAPGTCQVVSGCSIKTGSALLSWWLWGWWGRGRAGNSHRSLVHSGSTRKAGGGRQSVP